MTEHPSTAAIVALAVTVGTWIINFVAAIHGGVWETLAGYTPTAMVAEFQHGLIRLDIVLIALALIAFGLALAAIWMRLGVAVRRRVDESIALGGADRGGRIRRAPSSRASWDTSENRANSFSRAGRRGATGDPSSRCASRRTSRRRIRAASISSIARCRSCGACCRDVQVELRVGHVDRTIRTDGAALRRDLVRARRTRAMSRLTTAEGVLETI